MYITKKEMYFFSLLIRGSKVQVLVEEPENEEVTMKIATSFLLCTYNLPHTIARRSRQGPCRQDEGCCRFRFTDLGKQRTNQDGQHGVCNQQHGGPRAAYRTLFCLLQ